MIKLYLTLYNTASAVGWAMVWWITYLSLTAGDTATQYSGKVLDTLTLVQTAAALEILHSALGFVRSPLATTTMQVFSRLLLVWCYSRPVEACQHHWSLYLMVGSWATVEVPRYLFYAFNLWMPNVPYPLFFLRYNLFMVLYPSGISGEILQIYTSLAFLTPLCYKLSVSLFPLYAFGGPFMIMTMFAQRQRASRNRAAALGGGPAKRPEAGLVFPKDPRTGERSTTTAGKNIFAASIAAIDPAAADAVRRERNWRFGYAKHVIRNVETSFRSADTAVSIAKAGFTHAMDNFEFVRDGKSMSMAAAMSSITESFETGFIKGEQPKPSKTELRVPYKNGELSGSELIEQLNKWATTGTIEPSARDAIAMVAKNPGWLDLSDQYFCLLGAGSAMGPLLVLLALGANIVAVDLDRPGIWKRLIELTRNSPGTITFPLKKPQSSISDDDDLFASAGCNLFTQPAEIKNWLIGVAPGRPLTIGGYAYLDGALHVQVSLAMCAIMMGVIEQRENVSLGFLCSPTDIFVSPPDAAAAARDALNRIPLWQSLLRTIACGRCLRRNTRRPGQHGMVAVNGIVVPQGPNYALAKRLQHWTAMMCLTRGNVVSSNIAPSTATRSVVHNAQFAAAYGGFHHFKPMEVFYQETSNAVMATLLIHDLRNKKAASHPGVVANPITLFSEGAFHGGIWRCAFEIGSIGEVAALAFYLRTKTLQILLGVGAVVGWASWLIR